MNIEILGILGSVMVLISFLMKGEMKIRAINIIGAIIFVIYGIIINALSVWLLNAFLCISHIYNLIKMYKK